MRGGLRVRARARARANPNPNPNQELGSDYDGLRTLLLKMLKGDVSTADSADDAKAAEQAATP